MQSQLGEVTLPKFKIVNGQLDLRTPSGRASNGKYLQVLRANQNSQFTMNRAVQVSFTSDRCVSNLVSVSSP